MVDNQVGTRKDMSGFGSQKVATRKPRLAHNHMSTNKSLVSPIQFEYISDKCIPTSIKIKALYNNLLCPADGIQAFRIFGRYSVRYCHFTIGFIQPEYDISA